MIEMLNKSGPSIKPCDLLSSFPRTRIVIDMNQLLSIT